MADDGYAKTELILVRRIACLIMKILIVPSLEWVILPKETKENSKQYVNKLEEQGDEKNTPVSKTRQKYVSVKAFGISINKLPIIIVCQIDVLSVGLLLIIKYLYHCRK